MAGLQAGDYLITIKTGLEKDLGPLLQGEPAYTLDTGLLYIGGQSGNIAINLAQDAAKLGGHPVSDFVLESDLSGAPEAGKILIMDANGKLPTDITGKASSADKLATSRSIILTGDITGSGLFDGSGNLSISTQMSNTSGAVLKDSLEQHRGNYSYKYLGQKTTVAATAKETVTLKLVKKQYLGFFYVRVLVNTTTGAALTEKRFDVALAADGTIKSCNSKYTNVPTADTSLIGISDPLFDGTTFNIDIQNLGTAQVTMSIYLEGMCSDYLALSDATITDVAVSASVQPAPSYDSLFAGVKIKSTLEFDYSGPLVKTEDKTLGARFVSATASGFFGVGIGPNGPQLGVCDTDGAWLAQDSDIYMNGKKIPFYTETVDVSSDFLKFSSGFKIYQKTLTLTVTDLTEAFDAKLSMYRTAVKTWLLPENFQKTPSVNMSAASSSKLVVVNIESIAVNQVQFTLYSNTPQTNLDIPVTLTAFGI